MMGFMWGHWCWFDSMVVCLLYDYIDCKKGVA